MKGLYTKINNELKMIGYVKERTYNGELFYIVVRKGAFDEVYNKNELQDFIKEKNFIIK